MADQTTLPTCTPNSLGPTKVDRTAVIDPYKDESASQINLVNACIEELFRRAGLSVNPAVGSFQEALERLGFGNPLKRRFFDHFDLNQTMVPKEPWYVDSGTWVLYDAAGGRIAAPLDSGAECWLRWSGYPIWRAAKPMLVVKGCLDEIAAAPIVRFGFVDAAETGGFGVEYNVGTTALWRIYALVGGSYFYAALDNGPAPSLDQFLRVWIDGTPGSQVVHGQVGGLSAGVITWGNETTLTGHGIAQTFLSPLLFADNGTDAGKTVSADFAIVEADFTQDDT